MPRFFKKHFRGSHFVSDYSGHAQAQLCGVSHSDTSCDRVAVRDQARQNGAETKPKTIEVPHCNGPLKQEWFET